MFKLLVYIDKIPVSTYTKNVDDFFNTLSSINNNYNKVIAERSWAL